LAVYLMCTNAFAFSEGKVDWISLEIFPIGLGVNRFLKKCNLLEQLFF
jgi:hypothetical protein